MDYYVQVTHRKWQSPHCWPTGDDGPMWHVMTDSFCYTMRLRWEVHLDQLSTVTAMLEGMRHHQMVECIQRLEALGWDWHVEYIA